MRVAFVGHQNPSTPNRKLRRVERFWPVTGRLLFCQRGLLGTPARKVALSFVLLPLGIRLTTEHFNSVQVKLVKFGVCIAARSSGRYCFNTYLTNGKESISIRQICCGLPMSTVRGRTDSDVPPSRLSRRNARYDPAGGSYMARTTLHVVTFGSNLDEEDLHANISCFVLALICCYSFLFTSTALRGSPPPLSQPRLQHAVLTAIRTSRSCA